MEQQPKQTPQTSQASEGEIAAAIALILAGRVEVPSVVGAIAALLRMIPGLPSLSEDDVSLPVARMVSRISGATPKPGDAQIAVNAANLSYRAHYAIEATKRVALKVADGAGPREALSTERTHLVQHLEASEARSSGAALNEAAAKRWGPVLSWRHAASRKGAANHRASHVAADGANFDVRNPPQSTDGMLPGQALHCDCLPGAPIPGARMLG